MSIVNSTGISVINPDPVTASLKARYGMTGLNGLGCGNGTQQTIPWRDAYRRGTNAMGRDVNYAVVPLAGLGDWVPASYPVPQNPIVNNALVKGLAGLRGIDGFDTSSLSAFANSITQGTSFGDIPNWVLLAAGVLLVAGISSGRAPGYRRRGY